MRHLSRNVAIIGCYLMIAGGISDFQRGVDRNRRFLAFGRQMLGAFSILNAFMIWNSHDELRAHIVHIPGGKIVSYVFVVIYVLCGVTLYGGYESAFFSKLLAWLLTVVTVLVDMDTKFWWNTAHVRYFMEMTIASRSLCIIGTLILIRGNV